MRDSALFRRDIRDLGSKLEREAGIKIASGSRISCFHGVGIRDSGLERGTEWDPGFQSLFSRASETLEFAPPFLLALCFRVTHDRPAKEGYLQN